MNWIKYTKLVIHIDCMTSIEALSVGKKSLSLSYIVKNKSLCYKIPYFSSIHSKNFKEANKILRKIYFQNKNFKVKNNKIFKDFFGEKKDNPTKKLAKELVITAYSKDLRKPIDQSDQSFSGLFDQLLKDDRAMYMEPYQTMMEKPKPKTKFVYKDPPKYTTNEKFLRAELNDPKYKEQREMRRRITKLENSKTKNEAW